MIQIAGAIAFAVGLALFVAKQLRPDGEDAGAIKAWKIEMSGPPSLIAMGLGAAMMIFPALNETPDAPPTTTPSTIDTFITEPVYPPEGFHVEPLPECEGNAIWWDDTAATYLIQIAALAPDDTRDFEYEFDGYPPLCEWEIAIDGYDRYWLWVTSIGYDGTYSTDTWFEYTLGMEPGGIDYEN